LAEQAGPPRLGRGRAEARIGALLERRGELDPAALGAVKVLEAGARDLVVGPHAEHAAVLRLGVATAALAGADGGDLHQEIGGAGGGLGGLAHLLVERGEAIPGVLIGGPPGPARAHLALAAPGRPQPPAGPLAAPRPRA